MHTALARRLAILISCTVFGILAVHAPAEPAILWINGLSGEFKRADLALDKTTVFRQIPQGTTCPWFSLPKGKATFEVSGSAGLNLTGDWEFPDTTKALFITYGKEIAASRTVVLPTEPTAGFQALNAVGDALLQAGDKDGPAARAGFSLPIRPDGTARLTFADGAVWSIGLKAAVPDDIGVALFITFHQAKCDGAHDLMASVVDGVSGKSDEWMLIAGSGRESKEISQGSFRATFTPAPTLPAPPFDAATIDWTKVKSQIAWFNATPHNQSLAIGGMTVFRQLRAGSLAQFAPWPSGTYDCESHTNPGNRMGKASFTLDPEKRIVLVSIGLLDQQPRVVPIAALATVGENSSSSRKNPPTTIRIMNGLPAGELVLSTRFEGARVESGGVSKAVNVEPGVGFTDRVLLSLPESRDRSLQPKSPNFGTEPGDWVLIVYLNASDSEALDYAWVNFSTGTMLAREDLGAKPRDE